MAGLKLVATSGEITLAASTVKTILQVQAPTNQRILATGIRLTGQQPAGGVDVPVKVRLTRSTTNGTSATTVTPGKLNTSNPETVQSVVKTGFSVEPTVSADTNIWWNVQPQSGIIEFMPPAIYIEIPGGSSLNVECTPGSTGAVLAATLTYEE